MSVSIKISDDNYKRLSALSGRLRSDLQRPVSINEAISFLYKKKKLSDIAGAWEMSDKEVKEFTENLKEGWKRWKTKSV